MRHFLTALFLFCLLLPARVMSASETEAAPGAAEAPARPAIHATAAF
jgi:hypothetical protein